MPSAVVATLLWSAWNWDVVSGDDRLQIELPIATEGGEPIRQRIASEIVVSFGLEPAPSMPLAWGSSRCYPAIDPEDNSGAVLTVRDNPTAERRPVPNEQWTFARSENGVLVPDSTRIAVDGEAETAPGQLAVGELVELYRAPQLGAGTALFGLLGDPALGSLGPRLHLGGEVHGLPLPYAALVWLAEPKKPPP